MSDLATANEAARAQDERDINICGQMDAKVKTVADNFDMTPEAILSVYLQSRSRQFILHLLGGNT